MKKQFAVIGLGRFGGSVCKELYKMGHEVLAIDTNEDSIIIYTIGNPKWIYKKIIGVEKNEQSNII